MRSAQFGISLPTRELALAGAPDAGPVLDIVGRIEELGYDTVWAGDSFVARPRLEPVTLLAAVARETSNTLIGTAALIAPDRNPADLAHAIATLDQLSAGRLRMGIGVGLPLPVKAEHDAVTMPLRERRERVDEMVAAWRRAWNDEDGDLVGRYYDLSALRNQPKPSRPGGPPMWLAGNGAPVAVDRIAAGYDGWMPILVGVEEYGTRLQNIRAAVAEAGRDAQAMTPALYLNVLIAEDVEQARAGLDVYTRRYNGLPLPMMEEYQMYVGGSASQLTALIQEYVDAGAEQIIMRIGTFDDFEWQLRAIAEEVVPALRKAARA